MGNDVPPGTEFEHRQVRGAKNRRRRRPSVLDWRLAEEQEQEHRQVLSPVNRRARELRSPGAGGEGVQQTRFFSYRLVPGALPGMTGEPGSVGRRKTGNAPACN